MNVNFKWVVTIFVLLISVSSVAAQNVTSEHCAVELAAVIGQFDPDNPRLSTVVREGCFQSFAEAVSFATRGRIDLPASTSDADVIAAVERDMVTVSASTQRGGVTPQTTYTLAYMYDWSNFQTSGGTLTVSSSSLCSSSNFQAYNLTNFQSQGNWANRIESWQRAVGSGCNTGFFYASPNVAGAYTACGSPCAGLGTLNNNSESFVLVN